MKIPSSYQTKLTESQKKDSYFDNLTRWAKNRPLQATMIATALVVATYVGLHSFFKPAATFRKPIFPKLPEEPLTICQRLEMLTHYNCKTADYAQRLREKGLAELQKAGISLEELDKEIWQKPLVSVAVDPHLKGIAGYVDRLQKGILKIITVSRLKSLFGYSKLSNSKARKLYNQLDQAIPTILKSERLSIMSCEAQAKFAADGRSAIRKYIRDRIHTGRAKVNENRNKCVYGTPEPDFIFLRGTKNCSQIIQSSQKTSSFYNLLADYWPCI